MKLAFSSKQSVAIQLNNQLNKDMESACSALMAIFTTLRFLCSQGLNNRGHEDISSNFIQLLELRKEDVPGLKEWMEFSSYKWLSHDIQNEIVDILRKLVLRSVVCEMKKREHFAIMVDETCDISVHEQVTFCVQMRTLWDCMKHQTQREKHFLVLRRTFLRICLNIENLQGQYYDDLQQKAIYKHCAAHSLYLAVQDCLHHLLCMRNIMNLAKDLINTYNSSKNIREDEKIGLRPLCPTLWIVRASKEYSSDAASKCAGYLETMNHFRTFFFSNLYCHGMSPVEGYEQFWQKFLEEKPTHVEEPQLPRRRRIPKRLENPCATEPRIFFTPKDSFR
ncbi:hypothetical protein PR048_008121 [Dryococelus australis]|uniref:DUF4371 domain-containing protein n=1 Tax=Dryococelus australis TaxID=614101 RepID=A0ABQ9HW73_9NEOP|nr:hypothetical protein PR048_008121 [Dryococelus australis]